MGIPLAAANFTRGAAVPLDESSVVADQTARDALAAGIRYLGFRTYSIADKKTYILKNGITNSDWEEDGGSVLTTQFDKFSGDGTTTAFTLTYAPLSANNTALFINTVYQEKSQYTIVGTTLTISPAVDVGTDNIQIMYPAIGSIGAPSDNTVTQKKLALRGSSVTAMTAAGQILKTATFTQGNATGTFQVAKTTGNVITLGRPVRIELQPDGTTTGSLIEILSGSGDTPQGIVRLMRGVSGVYTEIARFGNLGGSFTGLSGTVVELPPGGINFTDTDVSAGTYTYQLEIAGGLGSTITIYRCKLVVYED